jgi:hypothetical protein
MALKKNKKKITPEQRAAFSLDVDWAIIDRAGSRLIGIIQSPHKSGVLRRIAIRAAIDNKLTYNNIRLVPVELLGEDEKVHFDVANAVVLEDPKGK